MNIAIIGTSAARVILFRAELIERLVQRGHNVLAFAPDYTPDTRAQVTALGATPVDFRFNPTGLNPFSDLANTWRLARLFRRRRIEVTFAYVVKPVIFATLAAWLAGVPRRLGMLEGLGYVFTDQPGGNSIKIRVLRRVQALLYRLTFPLLERMIFLNPDDPADLIDRYRIPVRKVSLLGPIGLDLSRYAYRPLGQGPFSFIFVGRLLAEKGINEYIEAARLVKRRHAQARFIMLGGLDEANPGGLTAAELEALVDDDIVIHPGYVTNVQDWIADAHVFVLPSYREGMPRSTQEAMAMGRAVITTDVPGCRETVEQGRNGFLVPPFDAHALAEKMLYFIEHPEEAERMGRESHGLASAHFDVHAANARLVRYIEHPESACADRQGDTP